MQQHSQHHKHRKILFGGVYWLPPVCLLLSVLSQMQLSHRAAHRVVLVNPLPLGTRLQGMALQRETLLTLTAKASENV